MVQIKAWCLFKLFRLLIIVSRFILPELGKTIKRNFPMMARKKPNPFDVGTSVAQKAGGKARIETFLKTIGPKTWE
jgi:hypothetical protein